MEHTHGRDFIISDLKEQRKTVTDFYKNNPSAVVNTNVKNYLLLLNPNSYQKGGWVLHMLRKKLGDDMFWEVIRTYYSEYKLSNASTVDFEDVAEKVSHKNLDTFFEQWLYKEGHPVLDTSWKFENGTLEINITQTQQSDLVFVFPIEVKIVHQDGHTEIKNLEVNDWEQTFEFEMNNTVSELNFDPNTWLLYVHAQGIH
jgi:aminopeptidase N